MRQENLQRITELRRFLHQHPELSGCETGTMEMLAAFIGRFTGFEIRRRDGWFYAVKKGTDPDGRRVAFRADMDALPIDEGIDLPYASQVDGVSHKCGHDGHMAALCGLALELNETETKKTVYLIFQPAEETGAGGEKCAALIAEEGISEVYAFHNLSGYPEGQIVYRRGLTQPASEGLEIVLTGRQSHASAPEEGVNPAAALARIALFSQISGGTSDTDKGVERLLLCTVTGLKAGSGDYGISAGEGSIRLTLRAEEEEEMAALEEAILSYAAEQAGEAGLEMTYSISDRFPETRNNETCLSKVLSRALFMGMDAVEMPEMWRASEDFGHYLQACPGAIVYIGNGVDYPPLHTREYDFNDRILPVAVDLFRELALR